jgi:hypothetical protein
LVGPGAVETAIDERNYSLDFFWSFLLPWSCLVCCEGIGEDVLQRIDIQAQRIRLLSRDVDDAPLPGSLITEDLPAEIWAVIEPGERDLPVAPPDLGATLVTLVPSGHSEGSSRLG